MAVPAVVFGYSPDPVDKRDWSYSGKFLTSRTESQLTIVEKLDWRSSVVAILDQEQLGSCVANAVFGAIRLKHTFDGIKDPKLGNRLHVYAGARAYIGMKEWDSGSNIRDAFRFINSVGFMPEDETDNGYDINKYTDLPTPREMRIMYDQKNKLEGQVVYYRVTEKGKNRIDTLKQAMSQGGVPVLGTATTRDFLRYKEGILSKPDSVERRTGGHAFYLCGYTPDYAIMANSWNVDWGIDGFGYIGWDWLGWDETRDIWIVQKAPYYSHLLE